MNQELATNDEEESGRVPDFLAEKYGLNTNIHQFLTTSRPSETDNRKHKVVKN